MSSSTTSTPKAAPKRPSSASTSQSGSPATFTPRQQDAQARHKDPYASGSSDSELDEREGRDRYGQDSHYQTQKRREAAIILDSPELLMMHAQARNDSIPGTRYHFTKQLCGYQERDEAREKAERDAECAARVKGYKGTKWEKPGSSS